MNKLFFLGLNVFVSIAAALGFFLITAEGYVDIPVSMIAGIVGFFQIQPLMVTVAKFGIDAYVFSRNYERMQQIDFTEFYIKRVLPVVFFMGFSLIFFFGFVFAVLASLSVALDVCSVIKVSEMNAKKFFSVGVYAALSNFPLFFLIFFGFRIYDFGLNYVLLTYVLCSLFRYFIVCFLVESRNSHKACVEEVPLSIAYLGLAYQVLNFLLFRLDQLLAVKLINDFNFLKQYLFLSKFVELSAAFFVVVGSIYFKDVVLYFRRRNLLFIPLCILCVFIVFGLYCHFGGHDEMSLSLTFFPLAAVLVLPVNYFTYVLVCNGNWRLLFISYLISLLVLIFLILYGFWLYAVFFGFSMFLIMSFKGVCSASRH